MSKTAKHSGNHRHFQVPHKPRLKTIDELGDDFTVEIETLFAAHGGVLHVPSLGRAARAFAQRCSNITAVNLREFSQPESREA